MQILREIKTLEEIASQLDPDPAQRAFWRNAVINHTEAYLQNIYKVPAKIEHPEKASALLKSPIQEEPEDIETLLQLVKKNVDEQGLKPSSPGYMAYIPGGGIYPTALGDYLAAIGNHYAGYFFASPGGVRMENMLISWVAEILGFDTSTVAGNLTSGGSFATLIAIHTAREAKQIRAADITQSVIYLTSQTHHAALKAIRVTGLGECIIRYVSMNEKYQMDVSDLENIIIADQEKGLKPFMVIGSAGTTDTGAVDNLETLGDICQKHNLWFHIDAAYGGFFTLVEETKSLFKGIETCDSLVIDPHKGLFLSFGAGIVLVKDKKHLLEAHTSQASYLQDLVNDPSELSPADLSPELSKHFRGMRMWLPLKLFGVATFRAALREKILLARYMYEEMQKIPGIELGPQPMLSVFIFRHIPKEGDINTHNQRLVKAIQDDGRVFLSSTMIGEEFLYPGRDFAFSYAFGPGGGLFGRN